MADTACPLVTDMLKRLLLCARTQSKELRVKIAMCLGELGAIDPERLDLDVSSELHVRTRYTLESIVRSMTYVLTLLPCFLQRFVSKPLEYEDEDEMAFQLISTYLLSAFRAARDTRGQDRAAFAIQV